jgi:YggT family protein
MGSIFVLLAQAIQLYTFVLLARIFMTWIPNLDPYNPIVRFLIQVTEPVLEPARRLIPPIGMIDISPIVVFFALQRYFICGLLAGSVKG